MSVHIDWERAEHVFGILLSRLKNREHPYQEIRVPHAQENLPENMELGGVEHARFLFCSCYWMRGGIRSDEAFRKLKRLHENAPALFNVHVISEDGVEDFVGNALKRCGLGFNVDQVKRFWVLNFRKLLTYWNGNPLSLFEGVGSYKELCDIIIRPRDMKYENFMNYSTGFLGFREKMVSMLLYFFADSGLLDPVPAPVPVDFHVLRMLVAHELITFTSDEDRTHRDALTSTARELTHGYCEKHDESMLQLCNALWILSRERCSIQPGNRSNSGPYKARATVVTPKEITWSSSQIENYKKSCAFCPVQDTCEWNIPSAMYYRKGVIELRGRRKPSPQITLF